MDGIDLKLVQELRDLSDKYEVVTFAQVDPSLCLRHYKDPCDAELLAFISAMVSFGRREQFLPIIKDIISDMDDCTGAKNYILSSKYKLWALRHKTHNKNIPCDGFSKLNNDNNATFYRFYKVSDYIMLCDRLKTLISEYGTMGEAVKKQYQNSDAKLCDCVSQLFYGCKIVPKGVSSPKKRVNMFLRWMVRGGPVDLGIWDWANKKSLFIPLDTHVIKTAKYLGLLPQNAGASMKTCVTLTKLMEQVFPGDPARADFALFGAGVNKRF